MVFILIHTYDDFWERTHALPYNISLKHAICITFCLPLAPLDEIYE